MSCIKPWAPFGDTAVGSKFDSALMMALPVPFGDALPGLTLAIFGLGIIQRDGVFILAGLIGTAVCGVYVTLVWTTVVAIIHGIAHWFGAIF